MCSKSVLSIALRLVESEGCNTDAHWAGPHEPKNPPNLELLSTLSMSALHRLWSEVLCTLNSALSELFMRIWQRAGEERARSRAAFSLKSPWLSHSITATHSSGVTVRAAFIWRTETICLSIQTFFSWFETWARTEYTRVAGGVVVVVVVMVV